MTQVSPWRAAFPALAALAERGQTYLDSAATAQKPHAMIDALARYYAQGAANVHRARHLLGDQVTSAFEACRQQVADWLQGGSAQQIIFTRGTTESLNLLAYSLQRQFQPGDEILISALEHHANLLPWQQLAQRQQLQLRVLPLTASGHVDIAQAEQMIGPRTRLLAISQLSNVLGTWQPLHSLLPLAKAQGALTVVDGAQGVVHGRQNLAALGCDFYVFSSHKVYGPDGLGILWGRPEALQLLEPWQFGGEMVRLADYQTAQFHPAPLGFEAGTPAIGAVLAFSASLDWLSEQDPQALLEHEQQLHSQLLAGLNAHPGVQVLGEPEAALASFVVDGIQAADLGQLLSEQGIALRTGQHCAMPLMKRLQLSSAVRVSLGLYNDAEDLQRFFKALDKALEILR